MPTVSKPPVRGTQTFVGVMASVWRRPSLMGLEVLWRWIPGALLLCMGGLLLGSFGMDVHFNTAVWQSLTVFEPVAAVRTLQMQLAGVFAPIAASSRWMLLTGSVLWQISAALGRTAVLRRLDRTLSACPATMLALGALRALLLLATWEIWFLGLKWSARVAILAPAARGAEPNLVLFCAMAICGTLLLYVLWGIVSWPFQLAPLLAMLESKGPLGSLASASRAGAVSGKLLEVNLVMNIVKLALIVLAMVLSASPLPFTNVATQTFLTCWWTGVVLLYFAMSDYFHVVRAAAYLRLWRAYKFSAEA